MPSTEPFVILSSPRCGSWLLAEALNEHPNIAANGEILNPHDVTWRHNSRSSMSDDQLLHLSFVDFPLRAHKVVSDRSGADIRRVGIKVVQLRPWQPERLSFLSKISALPGLRVIVIRRVNMLEALRSLEQAKATGEWIRYYNDPKPKPLAPLRIDPEFASMWFTEATAFYRAMRMLFVGRPVFDLAYESLISQPALSMNELWAFLDVPAFEGPRDLLEKQERRPARETVSNFCELAAYFRGTPYGIYFN